MNIISHLGYLLKYLFVGFRKKQVSINQLILDKTEIGYIILLSIQNCGFRCLRIDEIKIEMEFEHTIRVFTCEIVKGLNKTIYPGESIGAFLEITSIIKQERLKIRKVTIRDSENKKYQFDASQVINKLDK